jgi:hypothetical protein
LESNRTKCRPTRLIADQIMMLLLPSLHYRYNFTLIVPSVQTRTHRPASFPFKTSYGRPYRLDFYGDSVANKVYPSASIVPYSGISTASTTCYSLEVYTLLRHPLLPMVMVRSERFSRDTTVLASIHRCESTSASASLAACRYCFTSPFKHHSHSFFFPPSHPLQLRSSIIFSFCPDLPTVSPISRLSCDATAAVLFLA